MSDIHTLVGAYCPKYRESYLEYHQEDWINNALTRLMAQLRPGLRNPRAAQALRQKAKIRHTAPQNFLRTEVFPTAIRLVASEVTSTQRLRIGRKWVTNMHGKVLVASPWETPLTIPAFIRWFFSQVYAAATAIVLDEVYPRPTTQQAQLLVCEEHTLERLAALKSSSLRDNASLTVLLREDERRNFFYCYAKAYHATKQHRRWASHGVPSTSSYTANAKKPVDTERLSIFFLCKDFSQKLTL
jgi:hypothetical protein